MEVEGLSGGQARRRHIYLIDVLLEATRAAINPATTRNPIKSTPANAVPFVGLHVETRPLQGSCHIRGRDSQSIRSSTSQVTQASSRALPSSRGYLSWRRGSWMSRMFVG